ncbi:unnamed protein product [Rotaria magnacalcarata]
MSSYSTNTWLIQIRYCYDCDIDETSTILFLSSNKKKRLLVIDGYIHQQNKSTAKVPQMKYLKSIFGVDLTTLIKATTPASSAVSLTPVVLEKCINEIESRPNALDTEGLYRIAGFSDIVEEIKLAFERDCDHVDLSQERYPDIHAITCVLKLYLRQLPIPLITFDIHTQLLELRPTTLSIKTVRPIIRRLPPAHFHTLKYLSEHLLAVSHHSNRNQMTVENLSIVFAPTIMRSENPDPMIGLKNSKSIQRLLEIIIEQAHDIFSP